MKKSIAVIHECELRKEDYDENRWDAAARALEENIRGSVESGVTPAKEDVILLNTNVCDLSKWVVCGVRHYVTMIEFIMCEY